MHPDTALSSSRLSFPITNLQPSSSQAHLWALLRSVQKQNLFLYKARIFHWETGFPDLANLVAPVLQVSSVWHHPHATGTRQQQPGVMRGFGFRQGGKGSEMAQAGLVQPCGVTHGQMQHQEPAFHEELALLMRPESGSGISHTGDGWTRALAAHLQTQAQHLARPCCHSHRRVLQGALGFCLLPVSAGWGVCLLLL